MKRQHPLDKIREHKMRPLGKANPDWSFKQSEHIESLKHGYNESLIPCKKLPTTLFTRALEETPDWRQQLSLAWEKINETE